MNNSFKTLISIISIVIMLVFGYLLNDNNNLKIEIKQKELVIVQLEGKITDQQTEINLLAEDNKTKQTAIASLEEKARVSALAAQEAVDRLIELANIERGISPAEGPNETDEFGGRKEKELINIKPEANAEEKQSNSAAGNKNDKKNEVINDSSSKKFINLRNDIYSRYK